jgi:hypothetical protein
VLLLPLLLCGDRSHFSGSGYLWMVLAAYTLAKVLEWQDVTVLHAIGWLSGHSLKHVSAAGAGYVVLLALRRRDNRTASRHPVEQQRTPGRWRLRTRMK